jgi:DNA-binding transcriptional MerR regulator
VDQLPNLPDISTDKELAPVLRVTQRGLKYWRERGKGPKHVRLEGRIRYRKADVLAWLDRCAKKESAA